MKISVEWTSPPIQDFPKIKSPYVRDGDPYVVLPQIAENMEWVFGPAVRAVDKLHGTNISIHLDQGTLVAIDNRDTRIVNSPLLSKKFGAGMAAKAIEGVSNTIARGWLSELSDGQHFGELIGPDINTNLHELDSHLFVPFSYLYEKCHWHSWIQNKYPKTFDSISDWFKDLPSLFNQRINKKIIQAEGLIFYGPDGRMAKLRRDMFDWYKGERHKEAA